MLPVNNHLSGMKEKVIWKEKFPASSESQLEASDSEPNRFDILHPGAFACVFTNHSVACSAECVVRIHKLRLSGA